jgi:segregation and condensation protein A
MTAPPTNSADQTPFVVRLDAFSGPLDLLLHLIREQEVDIYDIPIAAIADQFLEAIDALGLKIQLLLPRPFDEEGWEDPRAELVRRLLEYEQVREVADWLAQQSSQHAGRFPRGWFADPPELPPRPITLSLAELLVAVEELVESLPEPVLHRVVPRPLDVEGATRRIEALLEERERLTLLDAIGEATSVADVLSVLIAVLELARLGRIRLAQRKTFGSVTIRREPDRTAV